jgi:hypothetical protein
LKNNRFVFFKAVKIVKKILPAFVSKKEGSKETRHKAANFKLQATRLKPNAKRHLDYNIPDFQFPTPNY